jgi:hypothetical protein
VAGAAGFGIGNWLENAASQALKIVITRSGLAHILDRHFLPGALNWIAKGFEKSIFDSSIDITRLIRMAESAKPIAQANGNLAWIVNAGARVGTDQAGAATSIYTVITDAAGNLITAHPGLP